MTGFTFIRMLTGTTLLSVAAAVAHAAADPAYKADIESWRAKVEKSLRSDNGWLTLAGRHELSPGTNTVGSGRDNQIVLAPGLAPERLGAIEVDADKDKVTLRLASGVEMFNARNDPIGFSERTLGTAVDRRDWVYRGRLSFHVIKRDKGKYILRVSDLENDVRKNFAGRIWYDVDPRMRVPAKFVPYKGKLIDIVNVLGESSQEPVAGYLEFRLHGRTQRLDALADPGEPLFVIFGDRTGESTTYPPGRFLQVAQPKNGKTVIDFNKAYNPPCAFSAFTTCPLPPPQNVLKSGIAAGEKFRGH
ncbi:MAG: DUF1684 domain-containing protein [Betaproteobacteria bacterium]|nr:DUF1684 domain-containing protein [Betaproteobacteria bacterium]